MGSDEEIMMVYNEHFEERQYVQNGVCAVLALSNPRLCARPQPLA
jgi:hypothetical protein